MKRRSFLKGLAAIFGLSLIPFKQIVVKVKDDNFHPYSIDPNNWKPKDIPKFQEHIDDCEDCRVRVSMGQSEGCRLHSHKEFSKPGWLL